MQIRSLMTFYYNDDDTLSAIQAELDNLKNVLNNTNATINTVTLEETDVMLLEISLTQVCAQKFIPL